MTKLRETENLLPPANSSSIVQMDPLVAMIERAARDPSIDMDRLERLLEMKERAELRQAHVAYAEAMTALQGELPEIAKRGKIDYGGGKKPLAYALWEDTNEQIKPVLLKHGFFLSFRIGQEDGKVTVTGILTHKGGHSEQTTMVLPVDTGGGKNTVQAYGSSTSYGKRYTASALLNLTSRGEDDDGVGAGKGALVGPEDIQLLRVMIGGYAKDAVKEEEALCGYLRIGFLSEMPLKDLARAKEALAKKAALAKAQAAKPQEGPSL